MEQDIINDYKRRADEARREIEKYERLINTYSLLRLVIFALVVLSIYLAVKVNEFSLLAVLFILLMLCFAWLVSRQSFFITQKNYFIALKTVNENEIASISTGSNIYDNGSAFEDEKHYYTADLDIFGNASLYQLISRAATSLGKQLLAGWLSSPSQKITILKRQESLKELLQKNDWKLDFQARLLFARKASADQFDRLFVYLRTPFKLSGEHFLRPYIRIAPYLLLSAIVAGYFYQVFYLIAIGIALVNFSILISKGSYLMKSGFVADKIGDALNNYVQVFEVIENTSWQSEACSDLSKRLKEKQTTRQIAELSRLINKLSYSLIMIVGFVLNVVFLWALKQVIAIEDWKRNNQQNLEDAFDVIAEYEALISLASLHINYPAWCFPEIAEGAGYTLAATRIAHPLINASSRIANDYELTNTYKIDIITGSNMAGKSTFLRTIGINTVLALCGAPVCAASMKVSVVTILSYMRIKDSLNESTSTFKAELDRLQMLLAAVDSDAKIFFLIDEMLRGTNSVDKYLGSKAVIEQLIHKKGVGMVATHDLQIAQLEKQYPDYIRNFYFDIQVKE
ncbi:MAG TPA: DNA mismatch repair protein MutS, partial [Mucilaginibacter sp.]